MGSDSMIVIHEDGEISTWSWVRDSWKWVSSGFGRLTLPPSVFEASSPRVISHVCIVPNTRIYWVESIIDDEELAQVMKNDPRIQSCALLACDYSFVTKPGAAPFELAPPILLSAWTQAVLGTWLAPSDGLWIHLSSSPRSPSLQLAHLSPISRKVTLWTAPKDAKILSHHPTTLEMVVLHESGQLTLLRPKQVTNAIRSSINSGNSNTDDSLSSYLTGLHASSAANDKPIQIESSPLSRLPQHLVSSIQSIHLNSHSLTAVSSSGWELFDIRSGGFPINAYKWPANTPMMHICKHLSSRDSGLGFWSKNGLWRLKSMSIAAYTSALTSRPIQTSQNAIQSSQNQLQQHFSSSLTPQLSAAMICRDWNLPRLESKYLLDILVDYTALELPTMQDTSIFITACDRMIPHLQSPILLLSILEEARMSSLACTITRQFINAYTGTQTPGMSVVSQNEVNLQAYHLFTTFNADTIELLKKFVHLASDDDILPHTRASTASIDEDSELRSKLASMAPSDCGKLGINEFSLYLNRYPGMLLLKLLEFSGLDVECLQSSSIHIQSASFDIMCEVAFLPPYNLGPAKVNTALLREEERPTHPDMFAALCLLLYRYEPQWLLPFVDILLREESMLDGRSLIPRRALSAIPAFDLKRHVSSSQSAQFGDQGNYRTRDLVHGSNFAKEKMVIDYDEEESGEQKDHFRLLARLGLYERAHRHSSALNTLLQLYHATRNERYWNMALYSIDSKSENFPGRQRIGLDSHTGGNAKFNAYLQKTRTELLTTLLMQCIDPANKLAGTSAFRDIFSRFSDNLTAMDLTTSLRQEYARIQPRQHLPSVLVNDSSAQMSVGTLRAQLQRLGVK